MMTDQNSRRFTYLLALVILFVTVAISYQNSFSGSFHSDDYTVIQSNPEIEHPELFWRFPPHYRQWLTASFAINFAQGGLNPWGYHAVNLALHLLTGCLLMGLIRVTLTEGWLWNSSDANRVAFIAGACFLLHPAHTETVTYISGRSNGLSSLLYLAALSLFALSQLKILGRTESRLALLATFVFCFGAFLSKETAITLPLGFLLYDFCFMRGDLWRPRTTRFKWIYGPILIGSVALVSGSSTFKIQAAHWLERIDWSRIADQLPVLAHGLKLIFLPINLTFDYDFPHASFLNGPVWWASLLLWLILLAAAWHSRRQQPPVLTFAIFWFLVILSPTNSILPRMDLLSERNLYLPSIGICWWAGMVVNGLMKKKSAIRLAPVVTTAFLSITLCFGVLTFARNKHYLNDITLWQDTLKKSPNKSEVHYYLAMAHYLAGDTVGSRAELEQLSRKDPELARRITASPEESGKQLERYLKLLDDLRQVVQSNPEQYKLYGQVYQELATLFKHPAPLYFTRLLLGAQQAEKGKLIQAEAEFRTALEARPHLPQAHLDLASLFLQKGMLEQALQETTQAESKIHLAPGLEPRLHITRARILLGQNKLDLARQEADRYLASSAANSEGYLLLGDIQLAQGNVNQAIAQWQQVTRPASLKGAARFKIGMAHIGQSRFAEAKQALSETVQLTPGNEAARFNLAKLILETGGDARLARHHLEILLADTTEAAKKIMIEQLLSRIPVEK